LSVASLDTTYSSLHGDARSRPLLNVFGNGRQLAARMYPSRADSVGVSLRAPGREAMLKSLDAWPMKSIY